MTAPGFPIPSSTAKRESRTKALGFFPLEEARLRPGRLLQQASLRSRRRYRGKGNIEKRRTYGETESSRRGLGGRGASREATKGKSTAKWKSSGGRDAARGSSTEQSLSSELRSRSVAVKPDGETFRAGSKTFATAPPLAIQSMRPSIFALLLFFSLLLFCHLLPLVVLKSPR